MPPLFPARLQWPPATDATGYRVLARNVVSEGLLKLETDTAEALINLPAPTDGEWPEWRVQVRAADGSWIEYLPYMDWPRADDAGGTVLGCPEDGALVHRFVVHDDTRGEIVLRAATLGSTYAIDWARLDPSHAHRWRVQRWTDGEWTDAGRYEPLTPGGRAAVLAEPSAARIERETDQAPVLFLFTCDTEARPRWMAEPDFARSIDQQIFGRFDGEEVGIGFQMDLLDEHGFKGTFFVDILSEYQFGDGSMQPVFDEILGRGHDVQLHLHPKPHLRFAKEESLRALSTTTTRDDPAAFRATMEVAIELFERRAGQRPVAYRAGAYRIFDSHFPVLRDLGILIDSSVNPFKNCNVEPWIQARTQPFWVDGVLELPITWHLWHDRTCWRAEQLRPTRSSTVQRPALAATVGAPGGPPATICYIAHSYSFLGAERTLDEAVAGAWRERWEQLVGAREAVTSSYNPGEPVVKLTHVDHPRIDVFKEILGTLAARDTVTGISLTELARRGEEWRGVTPSIDPLPGYDGRARRVTAAATRSYSESYLGLLESSKS